MFTNNEIKKKFDAVRNDSKKMHALRSWGVPISISLWIPYRLDSSYPKNKLLETDDTKWFVEYEDLESYFGKFYERNCKPDYDGVFFVCCMGEDGTFKDDHPENRYTDESRIYRNFLRKKYQKEHADEHGFEEPIEFTVHCRMKHRWADEFMSFLRYLESNGNVGHSSEVSFFADGDGDFRPEFTVDRDDLVDNLKPFMLKKGDGAAECMFDAG